MIIIIINNNSNNNNNNNFYINNNNGQIKSTLNYPSFTKVLVPPHSQMSTLDLEDPEDSDAELVYLHSCSLCQFARLCVRVYI